MLSESQRYERECAGKRQYATKRAAKDSLSYSRARGGPDLKPYACTWCGGFHLGHANVAPWLLAVPVPA